MASRYSYTYERTENYCYPNSDILINKLNIKDGHKLFEAERMFVAYRRTELEFNPIKGVLDFSHLKLIHKHLFQDVYNWAGDIRNCNIAKTDLFCLAQYIETYADDVFSKLEKQKYFLEEIYDEKIINLVELFADINALHPFREGNGRTQRTFIEMIAQINGIELDFTTVDEETMIIASHDSISGNYDKFIDMFNKCSSQIRKEQQLDNIDKYVLNNDLKIKLRKLII